MFYGQKKIKVFLKSKLQTCKVEMSYISRINISSVSTGRATFLPFNEDGTKDERNTAETDPLKFDSNFYVQYFHSNMEMCVKM